MNSRLILRTTQPIGASATELAEEAVVGAAATAETTATPGTFDFQRVRNFLMENLQMTSSEVKSIKGFPVTDVNDKFVLELSNPKLRYRLFSQCKTHNPMSYS